MERQNANMQQARLMKEIFNRVKSKVTEFTHIRTEAAIKEISSTISGKVLDKSFILQAKFLKESSIMTSQ
jgi:hypothetical protein